MSILAFILIQAAPVSENIVKPCADPSTQHQMNVCAYEAYQAADKNLNAQWEVTHNYMKDLDKDFKLQKETIK